MAEKISERRREQMRAAQRRFRAQHPERKRAAQKRYEDANRGRINARSLAAYHAMPAAKKTARMRANALQSRPAATARRVMREYGLTLEQYLTLIAAPCGICGRLDSGAHGKSMCIDHDHETGAVRGTLCHRCSSGMDLFDDNADRLLAAVRYLRKA